MLAFLTPYLLWIKLGAIAILVTLSIWYWNHYINSVEQRGYDKAVAEYNVEKIKAVAEAREKERVLTHKVQEAQNGRVKAEQDKKQAIASVVVADKRLRIALDSIASGMPTDTIETLRTRTAALTSIFGDCTTEYNKMGEAASGHAADSLMYQQAWPMRTP